ncbi:hypothetical protein Trydic_g3475 [Trypoxylus dichotomus]
MPRSSSIDSMVEAVWSETVLEAPLPIEKRPSLRPDRTLALVSPSVGRRMKGQRGVNDVMRSKLTTANVGKDWYGMLSGLHSPSRKYLTTVYFL